MRKQKRIVVWSWPQICTRSPAHVAYQHPCAEGRASGPWELGYQLQRPISEWHSVFLVSRGSAVSLELNSFLVSPCSPCRAQGLAPSRPSRAATDGRNMLQVKDPIISFPVATLRSWKETGEINDSEVFYLTGSSRKWSHQYVTIIQNC